MSIILNEVKLAAEAILAGQVILYPTDTVWGIGCDATNVTAIEQVKLIKGRTPDKSFIILVPTLRHALKYVAAPPIDVESIYAQFDGPTTVIFENAINLPSALLNADGSIAIRIPKDDFCIQLLKKINKPLVSTSANFTGMPTAPDYPSIDPALVAKMDYVVKWRQDDTAQRKPSSIVKVCNDGSITYIRK